ncbi:hypothetical protein [Neobacillus vireti]|uniref:hypothetical protein n=1 Tax=Neobacillus vireti TaxID=220686 RepID=UPI003000843A
MQTIIWAICAMLLLLLIISFLKLDFNLKGKIVVVLAAFVIALGGLAAVDLFPLWQTLLIMIVLTFFTAYIMDTRLGNLLYKSFSPEEESMEEMDLPFSNKRAVKETELELLDLEEMDLPLSAAIMAKQATVQSEALQVLEDGSENDDVSFLQDFDIEKQVSDHHDELEIVGGYLSEIETMLLEDSMEKNESVEEGWLDELADLESSTVEGHEIEERDKNEIQFDDAELEVLLSYKEVAAGTNIEKVNLKKELELQK